MKTVRMIVLGENAMGEADLLMLELELTDDQYRLGEHHEMAASMAHELDFTSKMVLDQQEVPRDMILKALDWIAEEPDQPSPTAPKF